MATPSLAMIPSAYADSKVYSVLPNNGDGDFTFNRDSSATRVGQNGLIQTVGFFGNELITNGDFATDSDWTKQAGWTISGGTANCDGTANNALRQNFSLPVGTLRIKFDVTARTQGSVNLWINKPAFTQLISADAVGSYEVDVVTTSGANNVFFYSASNFNGSIDNVSVQQILGDQPRLNYDINANGQVQSCPSLLLEPASTNLFPYSEDFSQSVWAKNSVGSASAPVVTLNYATSPDGTQNASRLQLEVSGSSSSDKSFIENTQTLDGSSTYTLTFYIKSNNGVNQNLIFLQNSVSGNAITATNEWIRIEQSVTSNTTNARGFGLMALGNIQQSVDVLIFAAQIEEQSYATSYIPTLNGASQTRAAETCFGAGTAATFNSIEGVFYCEIAALSNTNSFEDLSFSDGTSNNKIQFFLSGTNSITARVTAGGSTQFNHSYTSSDVTQFTKYAIKYKVNDFSMYVNGVQQSVGTSGSTFSANTLNTIIINDGNISDLEGKIRDIRVFNEALTDAQLKALTT